MAITTEQRGVITGMITAVFITAFTLVGSCLAWPPAAAQASPSDRLTLFAMSAWLPSLALAASIARLANHRFFTPQDIGGSASPDQTETARLLQALVQNTLEQVVLALAAYASWSILAPTQCLPAVAAASVLFLVGRVLFFARYEGGAAARSFGFAVTFYPTAALMLGSLCFMAIRWSATLHGA